MSNIVELSTSSLPSFVKRGELSAVSKALMGGNAGTGGKRISIRGGVFRLMSDGKEVASIEERHLDVVIVNAAPKVARTFYMAKYDENTPAAPDCWSPDGETPDATGKNVQSASCATCPQNIAGSGDGTSRACRYSQRLAVVLANNIDGDVMQLPLPAQSIFGKEEGDNRPLQAYARAIGAMGAGADMVVTRLKFDTKAAVPKLYFKAVRWLTDDEYAIATERGQTREAINAITMTITQTDRVLTGVAGTPPKATVSMPAPEAVKPKTAKVPRVAAEEDDGGAEPAKRASTTKAATETKDLSKLVDEWGDTDD